MGSSILRASLFFLHASAALAILQQFTFMRSGSNATCGDPTDPDRYPYGCGNTGICSFDNDSFKYYCCEPGSNICQIFANEDTCDVKGSNGKPNSNGPNQAFCGDKNSDYWCCDSSSEKCTGRANNIRFCWAQFDNPFASVDPKKLGEIFSSSEAATPDATTFTINTASLFQQLSPSSTSSAPAESSSSSADADPAGSGSGLSGGAIGGIVAGAVAGLAAVGIFIFVFLRRRKNSTVEERQELTKTQHRPHNDYPQQGYTDQTAYGQPGFNNQQTAYAGQEYYPKNAELEAPAVHPNASPAAFPAELDAGRR